MGSSFLFYRELLLAHELGRIFAYEDYVCSQPIPEGYTWGPYFRSLFRTTVGDITERVYKSAEGSICDIIEDYILDMEALSREAELYSNRMALVMRAEYARKILKIFEKENDQ